MLKKFSLIGNQIEGKVRESLKVVTRTSLLLQNNIIEDNYININQENLLYLSHQNILRERISSDHLFDERHARFVAIRKIQLRYSITIDKFQLGFNCKSSQQRHEGNSQILCLFKIEKTISSSLLFRFFLGSYLKICFCDFQCRILFLVLVSTKILIPFLGLIVILFFFWILNTFWQLFFFKFRFLQFFF